MKTCLVSMFISFFRRENTWEPVENLQNCLDEVKKFERTREYSELVSCMLSVAFMVKKMVKCKVKCGWNFAFQLHAVTGFDLGLKIKKVTGVRQLNVEELPDASLSDRILYFVEWEDSGRVDLVPSKIVREKAPQYIIDYFTSIIRWAPPPSSFVDAELEGQREGEAKADSSRVSQSVGSVAAQPVTEVAGIPGRAGNVLKLIDSWVSQKI